MLKGLSDRPDIEKLERFLDRLIERRGEDVEFAVLFGSMARGNWSIGSDYDVLIGLQVADGKRLVDRIGDFETLVRGNIQVFPYDRPAWERMFRGFHSLLLEALEHGVVLFDRGGFAAMREIFREWRSTGLVTPLKSGWKIGDQTDR